MRTILLSFLVLMILLLVVGMLTGFTGILHTTPLVAIRGSVQATPSGAGVLVLFNIGGATVSLNPAYLGDGPSPVRFVIREGTGKVLPVGLSEASTNKTWSPGSTIFLYRDENGYWVTDSIPARLTRIPSLGPVIDIPRDVTLTVTVLDVKTNVTVASVAFIQGTGP